MASARPTALVTGSSGLIGSEAVVYFDALGWRVVGLDNNMRNYFFGPDGDTSWNRDRLLATTERFEHRDVDIRDRDTVLGTYKEIRPDLTVHCAAQPSHDLAARLPFDDWDVNATGTLNLLEAARQACAESPFVFMSTNKVYGDAPNEMPLVELERRWEYADPADWQGVNESCRIDATLHSLFGASKVAADVAAQEYGRYFDMPVGIFRGGCLTGEHHSGAQLHGFLSYLAKCAVHGRPYSIFGYGGKQVRDNIHSSDVIRAFHLFAENPRPGEVYNLGGGRENSTSMLEAIDILEALVGKPMEWTYVDEPRRGDHICYISDLRKLEGHYPDWRVSVSLEDILERIVRAEMAGIDG